ncbi:hypothetical protein [Pseudoalteromonas luteoviolacea]|uniref:Terminase large subunit gp17-like C-terminal domain-containing protein n=1 Tax=Pseudoalteromonas luteoviolacea S4054 TaxID=1129367 RepID=A0A0F6AD43_9GAMM|nr:hypothetical protein [Pseudoalteromonas luteoviolacea]AOT08225.1 hypothetical protein S4054249_10410 [Pseudoalteromonas luteoviolacea]AOT13141.1 hypothetical protein S40542_10385 [Pseudoalteromonas luteoviolacea]AOT18053.1 hypothetical protein S4054_10380 [Pseudoalteromonas luteoviolacea]KKE84137.1 hypothetical protein N479_09665 [Pseudoalteromonas luteoviolacea S4054]KZN75825.1 hypothetical protein N481_07750 [Pseudoalteromonas luteoviolacea S4047-1]
MADISNKEFLEELEQITSALRIDIEAKQRDIDPSPEAILERRQRVLGGDFEFFVYTYFPHHMWLDEGQKPSEFQQYFMDWFPKAIDLDNYWKHWFVAPRGEGKSTLAVKIAPVYIAVLALLQDEAVCEELGLTKPNIYIDFVILFGAEAKMPAKTLEVVKTELLSNGNLMLDFPEVCAKSPLWKIGEFATPQGVRFESRGSEQSVRGAFHGASRPKLLLSDDIITDKEAKSATERDNRWAFLEAAVQYLGPPGKGVKFLGVNTVLNNDDPISRAEHAAGHIVHRFKAISQLPENMELWEQCRELMLYKDKEFEKQAAGKGRAVALEDKPSFKFWIKNKKRMSKGAKTSWPSVRSLYDLMAMRASNKREFNREMQGIAKSDEEQIFYRFETWVNRLNLWTPYGACDPSMGKTASADPSALLVGFWAKELGQLHLEYESRKVRGPSRLLKDLIKLQLEYKCLVWGFENNNAFDFMRQTYMKDALDEGVALPLRGVTATVPQEERIEGLEPFVINEPSQILFHTRRSRLLIDELENWPEKQSLHHYDLSCALTILWMIASTGAGGIPKIRSRKVTKSIGGYHV